MGGKSARRTCNCTSLLRTVHAASGRLGREEPAGVRRLGLPAARSAGSPSRSVLGFLLRGDGLDRLGPGCDTSWSLFPFDVRSALAARPSSMRRCAVRKISSRRRGVETDDVEHPAVVRARDRETVRDHPDHDESCLDPRGAGGTRRAPATGWHVARPRLAVGCRITNVSRSSCGPCASAYSIGSAAQLGAAEREVGDRPDRVTSSRRRGLIESGRDAVRAAAEGPRTGRSSYASPRRRSRPGSYRPRSPRSRARALPMRRAASASGRRRPCRGPSSPTSSSASRNRFPVGSTFSNAV